QQQPMEHRENGRERSHPTPQLNLVRHGLRSLRALRRDQGVTSTKGHNAWLVGPDESAAATTRSQLLARRPLRGTSSEAARHPPPTVDRERTRGSTTAATGILARQRVCSNRPRRSLAACLGRK